jgi:6-phosphogluconolactonase (cycloisomerase 2 family)
VSVSGSTTRDRADEATCGFGGGAGAMDAVYEYVAPAAATYDISVLDAGFGAILSVRDQSCAPTTNELACDNDRRANGAARVAVSLGAGQRIAIVIDGDQRGGGSFELDINRRQADLAIEDVGAPTHTAPGAAFGVQATVANRGDLVSEPFAIEFVFARAGDPGRAVSIFPLRCQVGPLAPNTRMTCAPPNPMVVPLVASGAYLLTVRADADGAVDERREDNNAFERPIQFTRSVGTVLEQHAFRAGDGTVYQLVQAVPVLRATDEGRFRLTTLAASAGEVLGCVTDGSTGGDLIQTAAATATLLDPALVRRTAVLTPNDFTDFQFDPEDGGRLQLGGGPGGVEVCSRPAACPDAAPLAPLGDDSGGVPPACVARRAAPGFCGGESMQESLGFGLGAVDGDCADPTRLSTTAEVCDLPRADGFTLEPGQAVVFVYQPGRQPVEVGIGGFGLAATAGNRPRCGAGQIVSALAETAEVPRAGLLSLVETERGVGLFPSGLATSPDERHLYFVTDRLLAVLARDAETGLLQPLQELSEGADGVRGLVGAHAVVVSSDDRSLYVRGPSTLAVFARNADGTVERRQLLRDGAGGVEGLSEPACSLSCPQSMVIAPDGRHVYTASLGRGDGIGIFARDPEQGTLRFVEVYDASGSGGIGVGHLAVSPDGVHVYATSAAATVAVLLRDPATGRLEPLGVTSVGEPPRRSERIAVSADGANVYAVADVGVVSFVRDPGSGMLSMLAMDGVATTDLRSLAVTGDDRVVILQTQGQLSVFDRNPGEGRLGFRQHVDSPSFQLSSTTAARDGRPGFAYVDGVDASARGIAVFQIADSDTLLERIAFDTSLSRERCTLSSVHLSPDGIHAYGDPSTFVGSPLAVCARDPDPGALRFIAEEGDILDGSVAAMSPDGLSLYVRSGNSMKVARRTPSTGRLQVLQTLTGADFELEDDRSFGATIILPDDRRILTVLSGPPSNRVGLLDRDPEDGTVTVSATLTETAGERPPAASPTVFSPDGRHAYGAVGSVISLYALDLDAQSYDFVENVPLAQPTGAMTISPDGTFVYATERGAVAVLERDQGSGRLRVVERSSLPGVVFLGPVVLSPDGMLAVLDGARPPGRALFAFSRQATTGALHFIEQQQGELKDVSAVLGLTFGPDGRQLYASTLLGFLQNVQVSLYRVNP